MSSHRPSIGTPLVTICSFRASGAATVCDMLGVYGRLPSFDYTFVENGGGWHPG
jgi:hypothetical protein